MTRRQPSNYDLLEDIEANLVHANRIATLIDDWTGPSSASGGGGHTHVADSDPTGAAVEAILDKGGTPTTRLVDSAREQLDDLEQIRRITSRMNARRHGTLNLMELSDAKTRVNERTTPSTVGWCQACDRHQDATRDYAKLVNGLCNACRQAELRAWQQATTQDPANRQLFRQQWIRNEQARRREQHAS